jgi:hypothetical protein
MKINLNNYALVKADLQRIVALQRDTSIERCITIVSVATHVPLIAVAFFVGEAMGWPQEILDMIERLTKEYGYDEVIGIPESFPKERE